MSVDDDDDMVRGRKRAIESITHSDHIVPGNRARQETTKRGRKTWERGILVDRLDRHAVLVHGDHDEIDGAVGHDVDTGRHEVGAKPLVDQPLAVEAEHDPLLLQHLAEGALDVVVVVRLQVVAIKRPDRDQAEPVALLSRRGRMGVGARRGV